MGRRRVGASPPPRPLPVDPRYPNTATARKASEDIAVPFACPPRLPGPVRSWRRVRPREGAGRAGLHLRSPCADGPRAPDPVARGWRGQNPGQGLGGRGRPGWPEGRAGRFARTVPRSPQVQSGPAARSGGGPRLQLWAAEARSGGGSGHHQLPSRRAQVSTNASPSPALSRRGPLLREYRRSESVPASPSSPHGPWPPDGSRLVTRGLRPAAASPHQLPSLQNLQPDLRKLQNTMASRALSAASCRRPSTLRCSTQDALFQASLPVLPDSRWPNAGSLCV
uniref:collagen alpha-1(II) chain-like n=1 Tax=Ictidomys tridecemlineatus TaxID=43179 RepID=UPI001A9DEC3B|nr:collagen alpha-1(II) chain-like [Ictidomys tridecemlineatus]